MPFAREIPTDRLFPAPQHQELLARLQDTIRHRAFAVVTGEVGAGKSTAIRALYDQLDRTHHLFVYIADSRLTPSAFYRDVLTQFGVAPPFHGREVKRLFERIHMDPISPLTFILAGQSELRGLLRLRTFEGIAQRVQVRFHLTGLEETETLAYIQHHLHLAGADRPLFSEQALRKIVTESRGIPLVINTICTSCLLDACAHDQRLVEEAHVERVLLELQDTQAPRGGSPW